MPSRIYLYPQYQPTKKASWYTLRVNGVQVLNDAHLKRLTHLFMKRAKLNVSERPSYTFRMIMKIKNSETGYIKHYAVAIVSANENGEIVAQTSGNYKDFPTPSGASITYDRAGEIPIIYDSIENGVFTVSAIKGRA